jgi:hypothetical protein
MESNIRLLELSYSLLKLNVMHQEISLKMMKIWMSLSICFDHLRYVVHAVVVLILLL